MPLSIAQLGPERLKKRVEANLASTEERDRRTEYSRRVLILQDKFGPLVYQRIVRVYDKKASHAELIKYIHAGTNVLGRVVRELAFVYARPPARRLRLEGPVGEALNQRFAAAYAEARIAARAKQWGQYAFGLNVVWIVPGVWDRVAGRRLEFDLVLPHSAERIVSDDPRYTDILLWPHSTGWHATDGDAYYWLDKNFAVERRVDHGLGRQPAEELRVSEPPPGDYWDTGRGSKLVEATLECGRIAAAMSWVRKGQNRKLVTAFGEIGGLDADQAASPEGAITAKTKDPGGIDFAVHEFATAIKDFKDEMRWHVEQATESYGIPITTVDPEPASTGDAVNVFQPAGPQLHAAQSELRDDQIEYARPFEHSLAVTTHEVLARNRHPFSVSPEIVRDLFECRWQPLTFVDQPMNRLAVYEKKMALGFMSHADAYLEEYGGSMTTEEAHRQVMLNLERKAEIDLYYAQHNMPVDPRVESLPQIQGRQGGQQTAANAAHQEETTQP